ncbi:DUF5060 domain-containing protein [Streptomyces sp. NPDC058221]|uniref:DUF5060 domain-containing protein n=1 Tax=Streptomyces sp. NPDC058221 TaxID=3346388 RepID=UPI0036E4FC14
MSSTILRRIGAVTLLLGGLTVGPLGTGSAAEAGSVPSAGTVEQWRTLELQLTAHSTYPKPLEDVQVNAVFRGPAGQTLTRPAFRDGGSTWKVRFAPPTTGRWTMTTSATNPDDTGLHGVRRAVRAVPYSGNQPIYRHGFLKPSADGHYLRHADGTPFFYLGDTHWILPHERFDTSNAPGVTSQFRSVVDKRVRQGFTVYQ